MKASTNKPKILIVGPGPSQVGGLATFVEILLNSETLNKNYELIHFDITRGKRGDGIASRFAIINLFYLARQSLALIWVGLTKRPRIMHVPFTSFWAFWKDTFFILLARAFGIKVVAHLHGGVFDRYFRESHPWVRRLIGWSMSRADVVITLSEQWKKFLLEEVRPDLRVDVIPNSVDSAFAHASLEDTQPLRSDRKTVLFVGGLGHRKGVYDILKAIPRVAEKHPTVRFLFAGQEEARGEWERIEKVWSENHLEEHAQFLGCVTGLAKLDLFLRADIFLLPSYGENLPYSLLEAMAAGLPVVATPVGAIPEIVEEGRNGFLIPPGDVQSLAERIMQLLGDPRLRILMSHANREKIRHGYMPESSMTHFDTVYKKLLARETSARAKPFSRPEMKRRSP